MKQHSLPTSGIIIKGIGGFYYVKTAESVIECKARGLFRKQNITPFIGDIVEISYNKDGTGSIIGIAQRENEMIRPPVANIDQIVIVASLLDPKPNFDIIDKLLLMAESNDLEILIAFNKVDIADEEIINKAKEIYEPIYDFCFVSGLKGSGIPELKEKINGKKVAFAGPSGVGKSTIINYILDTFAMETGDISKKTKRGKHTTRHVELLDAGDGTLIFDTPGFTSFGVIGIEKEQLEQYFPEIEKIRGNCKYKGCAHILEEDCAVKKALLTGEIAKSRYVSYVAMYKEIQEKILW